MKKNLKKLFLFVAVVVTVVICFAFSASAETEGYYTYSVLDDEATITDVDTSISGNVTIPSKLGGYSVTNIGDYAFGWCESLTSITIPASVTSIGDSAFSYCTSLTSITIPDSVTSIGEYAFNHCESLTSITLPDSVTSIGYQTFYNCSSLTSITIPDSVTTIGSYAFGNCTSLKSITIPDSVTSIGDYAFSCCIRLTSITIPDSVTSILDRAFYLCVNLSSISVDENNQHYSNDECGVLFNKGKTQLIQYTLGSLSQSYVIPDSVTSIGDAAFYNCTSLTNITIPDSVISIGDYAFYYCLNLISITIPDSVRSIGDGAFDYCTRLASITIPNSVRSIGEVTFGYCTSLTSITIPDSVTSIGESAFYYCESLTSITIPDSVTSIGYDAFSYCTSLTSITIPDSVTSIGHYAFAHCTSLISITIPNSVTSIGYYAFSSCTSLTSITIPDSVTSIGFYAFCYCESLTSITIPDSVTSIGYGAFSSCKSLTNITIPDSVTSIGYYAFSDCESLTSITIPDSVTSIGYGAFSSCKSLTNITIPDSVTSIGDGAFQHCTSLTNITLPDSVTSIGYQTFYSCESLTSITIPDSVTRIGRFAFENCTSLTDVFYSGSEEDWKEISIDTNNECLTNAEIHYNFHKQPSWDGNGATVFNEKSYIADIWLDRIPYETKTPESEIINELLTYDSLSSGIYTGLLDDGGFQASLACWNGLEVCFDGVKALERNLSKDEIYETLILDLLRKVMLEKEDETGNIILDAVSDIGKISEKSTKYKSAVDDLATITEFSTDGLLETLKNIKMDLSNETFTKFYGSLNDSSYIAKKWNNSKFVENVGFIAEAANDVAVFYKRFVGYCLAVDMAEEMVTLLKEMRKSTQNIPFKYALSNVINSFQNADYAAMVSVLEFAEDTTYNFMDKCFDEVAKTSAVYTSLRTIYKAGVAFVDLTMNTSKLIDSYYLCEATYNFIDANKSAIDILAQNYETSGLENDAGAYVYAIRTYEKVIEIDLQTAVKAAKAATDEGLINLTEKAGRTVYNFLTGNNEQSSYEEMLNSKDSIMSSVSGHFWWLDNSWKFNQDYLKKDFPEVYAIYVKEELSEDRYTPIINGWYWAKDGRIEIEWEQPSYFCTTNSEGEEEYYTLYGNSAINGINLVEKTGSYNNSTDYPYGKAVNPLRTYNEATFDVFEKNYSLSSYSETVNGNVYSPACTLKVYNPIQKVSLHLPQIRDMFFNGKNTDLVSIAIVDKSSLVYDNIKYEIYRQNPGSSDWVLVETISRTPQLNNKHTTIYTDESAWVAKTSHKYKVRSYIEFDNGKKVYSEMSDVFEFKKSKDTDSVGQVYTRTFKNGLALSSRTFARQRNTVNASYVELSWDSFDNATAYEVYRMSSLSDTYNLIATVGEDVCSLCDYNVCNGDSYNYVVVPVILASDGAQVYDISNFAKGEVTFDLGEAYTLSWIIGDDVKIESYIVGSEINEPDIDDKDGCKFIGWDITVPETMPEQNLEIVALWDEHVHSYVSEITKMPTCTAGGEITETCSCGQKMVNSTSALGHSYSTEFTVDEEPTCTQEGSKSKHCTRAGCDAKTSVTSILKLPHTGATAVVENKVEAKCEAKGSYDEVVYCSVCNAEISRIAKEIAATGHKWNEGAINPISTCKTYGTNTFTCQNDASHTKTEQVALDSNNHEGGTYFKNKVDVTCTVDGYTGDIYCSGCSAKLSSGETVSAIGHTFTEKIIDSAHLVSPATTQSPAIYKYDCANCDSISEELTFTHGEKLNSVLGKTSKITATQTVNSINLSWSPVEGADGYKIFQKIDGKWKDIGNRTVTTSSIKNLKAGTEYTFAVKAGKIVDGKVIWSDTYTTINTATKAVAPKTITSAQNTTAIRLTWSKCPGATGYRIYYKSGNTWKICLNATTATSHTFTNLKAGTKFTFAVRPYIITDSGVVWSDYTTYTASTLPAIPKTAVASPSSGKITVKWNAVSGAEAYQLYYKTGNGAYKLYKNYFSAQTVSFSGLKSGTKYTFAVRAAVKTSGGWVFGSFTPVSVTVK